jgi:hypothetical protein
MIFCETWYADLFRAVCKGLQGKRGEQQATSNDNDLSVQFNSSTPHFPVYFGDVSPEVR